MNRDFQLPMLRPICLIALAAIVGGVLLAANPCVFAQVQTAAKTAEFPVELVKWMPRPGNPVFTAEGSGHWDVKIRERGWVLRDGDRFRMWYTGYDGNRDGMKLLGYATSPDGLHWTPSPKNPLVPDHWVEDMSIVEHDGTFFMFAEGQHDNHAEMLTSSNGIEWKWEGALEVRTADGKLAAKKPCGTPTVWVEGGVWYLFYEWLDRGVWLATTTNPQAPRVDERAGRAGVKPRSGCL